MPSSRLIRCRSRITTWLVGGSSEATGSSARMTRGCWASALAMPTRWRWPPERFDAAYVGLLDDLDAFQRLHGDLDVGFGIEAEQGAPRRHSVQPAHQHVVQHCRAIDEVEGLEDHPDVGAQVAHLASRQTCDVHPVDLQVPRCQRNETVDRTDQRRLARSGQPDDNHELAVADLQVDVSQGVDATAVRHTRLLEPDHAVYP